MTKTTVTKKATPPKKNGVKGEQDAQPLYAAMESKGRYKRWFHKLLSITLVSGALNLILLIALIVSVQMEAPPKTFAVTNDFRVMELPPLDQEYYTDARLTHWAMQTVPQVLSLDFDKWRNTLQVAQDKFSPEALARFVTLLQEKGWLDLVRDRRLLIRCGVTSPPAIVKRWVKDGRHAWEVQMPVVVAIESTAGTLKTSTYTTRLILERCSTRESPRGVWIKVLQLV